MNILFKNNLQIKKEDIPGDVLFILKEFKDAGFWSFLVGGCVRDLMLQKSVKDWDIITNARVEQIERIFSRHRTLHIGKSFPTITLILNHKSYQITSFDSSNHSEFVDDHRKLWERLQNNLHCRDFTINAMAWNPEKGFLDPSNGLKDLHQKILRSNNPDERFQEDPVRMLRAVRIATELNFTISIEIKRSMIKHAFLIHIVSPERIREELYSILKSPDVKRGILLLQRFGLERYIFSMDRIKKELFSKTREKPVYLSGLDALKGDLSAQSALWGRFYFGSCQSARVFYLPVIKHLRFRKTIIERVKILLSKEWEELDFSSSVKIRFFIAQFGRENTELMISLKEILLWSGKDISQKNNLTLEKKLLNKEFQMNHPVKLSDLAINGDDLIKMGLSEGKKVGAILGIVLENVLLHPENNHKEYLVKFAQRLINKI